MQEIVLNHRISARKTDRMKILKISSHLELILPAFFFLSKNARGDQYKQEGEKSHLLISDLILPSSRVITLLALSITR